MSEVFVLDVILLLLVIATAIAVVQIRSLFSATILGGIYSLLMAVVWTNMHALDVAFTEAAVGAGISTILLLGAIVRTRRISKDDTRINLPALAVCGATGAMLIYGTLDMPEFGDPSAPIHQYRVKELLAQQVGRVDGAPASPDHRPTEHANSVLNASDHRSTHEPSEAHGHPKDDFNGHVPNTVTSLLAAYRGFDTMFETTVIFVAGISMVLMLRRREDEEAIDDEGPDDEAEQRKGWEARS